MTLPKLHEMFQYRFDDDTISEAGQDAIDRYIDLQNLRDEEWVSILLKKGDYDPYWIGKKRLPAIPENWSWKYVDNSNKKYRGAFASRLKAWYYKEHGIPDVPEAFFQKINEIARSHVLSERQFFFMLTDNVDWKAGKFGENEKVSCYWNSRVKDRYFLESKGVLAFCGYKSPEETQKGEGRCWILKNQPEPGMHILFNGYGYVGDALLTIANVLSGFTGLVAKRVRFENNERYDAEFYINVDTDTKGRAYVLGSREQINRCPDLIDLRWKREEIGVCDLTGRPIFVDDDVIETDEGTVIRRLYETLGMRCENCSSFLLKEDAKVVGDGTRICEHCYINECGHCGYTRKRYLTSDLVYVWGEGYNVCSQVFEEHCGVCELSGKTYFEYDLVDVPYVDVVTNEIVSTVKVSANELLHRANIFLQSYPTIASLPDAFFSLVKGTAKTSLKKKKESLISIYLDDVSSLFFDLLKSDLQNSIHFTTALKTDWYTIYGLTVLKDIKNDDAG